jgi:hypothetical protein
MERILALQSLPIDIDNCHDNNFGCSCAVSELSRACSANSTFCAQEVIDH